MRATVCFRADTTTMPFLSEETTIQRCRRGRQRGWYIPTVHTVTLELCFCCEIKSSSNSSSNNNTSARSLCPVRTRSSTRFALSLSLFFAHTHTHTERVQWLSRFWLQAQVKSIWGSICNCITSNIHAHAREKEGALLLHFLFAPVSNRIKGQRQESTPFGHTTVKGRFYTNTHTHTRRNILRVTGSNKRNATEATFTEARDRVYIAAHHQPPIPHLCVRVCMCVCVCVCKCTPMKAMMMISSTIAAAAAATHSREVLWIRTLFLSHSLIIS